MEGINLQPIRKEILSCLCDSFYILRLQCWHLNAKCRLSTKHSSDSLFQCFPGLEPRSGTGPGGRCTQNKQQVILFITNICQALRNFRIIMWGLEL